LYHALENGNERTHVSWLSLAKNFGVDREVGVIARVSTIVGLMGIVDTVWFYVTGSKSWIPNASFSAVWSWFTLYINLFVPGIIVGLGLRTRDVFFRFLGIALSVVWAVAGVGLMIGGVFVLFHAANVLVLADAIVSIAFSLGLLVYCLWEINVLCGRGSAEYFSGPPW
jgi:hypothetical protein